MQESLQAKFKDYIAGEIPQFKILPVVIDASQTITVGSVLASKGISAEGEKFVKCNSAGTGCRFLIKKKNLSPPKSGIIKNTTSFT